MSEIEEIKRKKGFSKNISLSKRLRREGKSSEPFEIMLATLTLEEILALKLECAARLSGGKVYGYHLWSNLTEIIKEAMYNAVISVTNTNKDAARVLGITNKTFNKLKTKYNIREEYIDDL